VKLEFSSNSLVIARSSCDVAIHGSLECLLLKEAFDTLTDGFWPIVRVLALCFHIQLLGLPWITTAHASMSLVMTMEGGASNDDKAR